MYTFGSTENIVQILHYQKKGPNLNTIERFYIQKEAATDNQLKLLKPTGYVMRQQV
jgi:hypothetical protein